MSRCEGRWFRDECICGYWYVGEWVCVKDAGLGMSVSAGIGMWVGEWVGGWVGVKDSGLGMSVSAGIGIWVSGWVSESV